MKICKNVESAKVVEDNCQLSLKCHVFAIALAIMLSACGSETSTGSGVTPPGDTTPPVVSVVALAPDGFSATGYSLRISGTATDDTAVDSVSIDFGEGKIPVNLEDDSFDEEITLPSRVAEVTITAIDAVGNQTLRSVNVELGVCGSFEVSEDSSPAPSNLPASLLHISEFSFWYESGNEFLLMFSEGKPYAFNVATLEPTSFAFMDPQFIAASGPLSAIYRDNANARTLAIADDGVISLPDDGSEPSCVVSLAQLLESHESLSANSKILASAFNQGGGRLFLYYGLLSGESGTHSRLIAYDLATASYSTLEQHSAQFSPRDPSGYWNDTYWKLAYIGYSPVRDEAVYSQSQIHSSDMYYFLTNSVKTSSGVALLEEDGAGVECRIAVDDYRNKLLFDEQCSSESSYELDLVTLLETPNPNLPESIPRKSQVSPATGQLWTIYDSSRFRVFDISGSGAVTDINPY